MAGLGAAPRRLSSSPCTTTGDEIIPFWHENLYREKLDFASRSKVTQLPIARYGHCTLTQRGLSGAPPTR
ncbi:MAG: hypothetical protein DME04_08465 [Candidatus Rokuibacteriota bacterium]|nr:MAG: hypothetical protein DME04_08465 [Candidatus Rokubacteria bacterium]